jgi:hypothetical protein
MNIATFPAGFNENSFIKAISIRPKRILASNSKLRKDGIQNISFPAFKALVHIDGKLQEFHTCEQAKDCVSYCYARQGSYLFGNSRIKHTRNLQFLLSDPYGFKDQLVKEIKTKVKHTKNFRGVRICDSGDQHPALFNVMRQVMIECPEVSFYAYTKSVKLMKDMKEAGLIPSNFTYVFSFGGHQDHLIDKSKDRHAIAFTSRSILRANGYTEAYNSDIPAWNRKNMRVGLIAHGNHKAMNKIKRLIGKVMDKSIAKALTQVA